MVFTIFYIYANRRSKWNSGKINYNYWIKRIEYNKIVVSQTSTMITVYMNVLQFGVCSNCYVLVYWLPTFWEIYEMQYLGYLSVRRYNLVNSISNVYPVVLQMPMFMPRDMCPVHACYSGVLSLHSSHRALELWDTTFPAVGSRISDVAPSLLNRCSELELRPSLHKPGDGSKLN